METYYVLPYAEFLNIYGGFLYLFNETSIAAVSIQEPYLTVDGATASQ